MPIICDTHALIWWMLTPEKLSVVANKAISDARESNKLMCSDFSLWEIAMLMQRGRLQCPLPAEEFLRKMIKGMRLSVLPITPAIAVLAQETRFNHGDPADRIIGATAISHDLALVTKDEQLQRVNGLRCIWL